MKSEVIRLNLFLLVFCSYDKIQLISSKGDTSSRGPPENQIVEHKQDNRNSSIDRILTVHYKNLTHEWKLSCLVPKKNRPKRRIKKRILLELLFPIPRVRTPRKRCPRGCKHACNRFDKLNSKLTNASNTIWMINNFPFNQTVLHVCSENTIVDEAEGTTKEIQEVKGLCYLPVVQQILQFKNAYKELNISMNVDVVESNRCSLICAILLAIAFVMRHALEFVYFVRGLTFLSIVSLLISLAVYASFKQLRNIPGLNNMFLAGNLALYYIFYMLWTFQPDDLYVCVITGMAMHYFYMSSVLWTKVCMIHMVRVFWCFKPNTGVYFQRRSVIWYCIYVFTVTLLLVITNIVKHEVLDNDASTPNSHNSFLGYDEKHCVLTNEAMLKHTALILLCMNIALIILVWIRTRWHPIKQTNTFSNRRMVVFYCIFSFVYLSKIIVDFVYDGTYNHFVGILFIMADSSHGIFFLVVFFTIPQIRWLKAFWKLTHKSVNLTKDSEMSASREITNTEFPANFETTDQQTDSED